MHRDLLASADIREITKPKSSGQPMNRHVVTSRKRKEPDFGHMRDVVHAPNTAREKEHA